MARRDFPRMDDHLRTGQLRPGATGHGANRGGLMPPAAGARPDPYGTALKRLRPWLIAVALFSALLNVLMLTGSVYMLQVYDRVLSSGSVPTLLGLFTIVVVLYGFLGLYDFLRVRMLTRAGLRLDAAMALPAFRAWLQSGTAGQGSGGQASAGTAPPSPDRPLHDLETVRGFAASPAAAILFDLPFAPLFIAVLFLLHPLLGWATLAGACIAAIVALAGRAVTERGLAAAAAAETAPRDLAEAGRRSAETVIAMGMDRPLADRWHAMHERALAAGQGTMQFNEGLSAGSRTFRLFLQSAILTLGAFLTLRGEITAGMIIAASILSGRALAPIDQAVGQAKMLGRTRDAHRRLKAFSAALPAPAQTITLPKPEAELSVEGLTRLAPARPGEEGRERRRILSEIRFTLAPGDAVGVIGPSASGKSTLARLLVGALPPDGGEVRLGGATLQQYAPERLMAHVGYLPQRVDLLPGTIRDNIARFDPAAADAVVIEAAQAAGVHEMILGLPEGYGTEISGAQGMLSGGQVQRIGLARALYGTPALVVLDEPNAHLDSAGDRALTKAVEQLRSAGAAVVIMAHRPGALAAVNKLMVLEKGCVAAFGDKRDVLDLIGAPGAIPDLTGPRSADGAVRFRKQSQPDQRPRAIVSVKPGKAAAGSAGPATAPKTEAANSASGAPRPAPPAPAVDAPRMARASGTNPSGKEPAAARRQTAGDPRVPVSAPLPRAERDGSAQLRPPPQTGGPGQDQAPTRAQRPSPPPRPEPAAPIAAAAASERPATEPATAGPGRHPAPPGTPPVARTIAQRFAQTNAGSRAPKPAPPTPHPRAAAAPPPRPDSLPDTVSGRALTPGTTPADGGYAPLPDAIRRKFTRRTNRAWEETQ